MTVFYSLNGHFMHTQNKWSISISETRMCSLSSTIVYRQMVSITPRLAAMFLVDHPEVDTDCSVSLENVIKHFSEKDRNVSITCGRDFGQKFCKCEKCQELKKLYINVKGRKRQRYEAGEQSGVMKLNYRHFDKRGSW